MVGKERDQNIQKHLGLYLSPEDLLVMCSRLKTTYLKDFPRSNLGICWNPEANELSRPFEY